MSEKSKVVIIGGTSNGIHSILMALNAADIDVVTVVTDEKTLHAELGEALREGSFSEETASKSTTRQKMRALMEGCFCSGGYTGNSKLADGELAGVVSDPECFAMRLPPIEEFVQGESICDPLQDAIGSTEIACRSAQGETLEIMQAHLKDLLKLQYFQLTGGGSES